MQGLEHPCSARHTTVVSRRSLPARVVSLATRCFLLTRAALTCAALTCAALTLGCDSRERVIINEFVAANGNGLTDKDGDTSDWIELLNTTSRAVNLSGWCLTDDPRQPRRWCFPELSLPAQGYLVVFASGKRRPEADLRELHTSFKLKSTADYLALVRPRGSVATEFSYPDQKQDVAFGYDSTGASGFLEKPTPGAPNSALAAGK